MADRKRTPDILGSLLGGDIKTPKKPVSKDTIKPEYHNTGMPEYHKDSIPEGKPTIKPARQPTSKTARQKAVTPPAEEAPGDKVKATYYISSQAVEDLEAGWIQLRRLAPKKTRGQISKSLIVELALKLALEELEAKGSNSQIARRSL